jgi:cytochrome c biogenesis protein CcmG/thiol:disulfide interchange protein DsbE
VVKKRPARSRALATAWVIAVLVGILGAPAGGAPVTPEALKALDLGPYPPDTNPPGFSGRTLKGETVALAGMRGRVVLLNFWASWCLECRPEMPMFERLHREFARQGLTVFGINVREDNETVRRYARELGLTFALVLDPDGKIAARYGVIGMPTSFLIGRDGRAVALAVGPREWASRKARAIIEALLTEPGGRAGTRR